jgi:hypothetical protein
MEHQTEDFGTVPPDQVPEAYAAEPSCGAASDIVGESAGNPADSEDDLDPDDEPDVDAGYAWGIDADGALDDAQEQPEADRGDEPAAVDDVLASLLAARQATGEPRVDAALAKLDDLAGMPVTEHRAVFEDVHRRLRDVLGELDAGQLPDAEGAESRRGR